MKLFILRFLERFAPQSFWQVARFEFLMFRIRRQLPRYRKQFAEQKDLKINFGAGCTGENGWVNVDVVLSPGVNCVVDCRADQPFANNSAKLIFTEHFLEHIEYPVDVRLFLSECHRILMPGALIRIVVPDAEQYLRAYCIDGWQELERLRLLGLGHSDPYFGVVYKTKMELVNMIFRQGAEHKFAYDYETLKRALEDCGFVQVTRMSWGTSIGDESPLDLASRAHESLYVEALKNS